MEEKQFIENLKLLRKELSDYAKELTGEDDGAHDLLLETVVRAFVEREKMPADMEQGVWMKQKMLRIYDERTACSKR